MMANETKTPRMFELLFGEAAETALQGASERLLLWAAAFDEWLAERKRNYGASTLKQSVLAWRRLLRQVRKMPWEIGAADIEQHATWMQEEGYATTTIYNSIGILANFYSWCDEHKSDPQSEAGFNPAAGVQRPKIRRYAQAKLLSQEECAALLGIMKRDKSPLGQRDYAFTLARLRCGVSLSKLQQLRWGQIEQNGQGIWVQWRSSTERQRLPMEVWEAIRAALAAGGRLAGMQARDYLFAPLVEPLKMETGSKAQDWQAGKSLSSSQLLGMLKLYGRTAGIAAEKLTLMALRRTAMRLRLDEGASPEEMRAFLDSPEAVKGSKYRLSKLPLLPQGEQVEGKGEEGEIQPPDHKGRPFKPGDGIKHGFYARSQPAGAVEAVLREDIQGVEEEIVGLRTLARGLLERQEQARNNQEALHLAEAYSLAAYRLAEMIKAEKALAERGESSQDAEEILEMLDQIQIELGKEPVAEAIRAEALGSKPELEITSRRLAEEIASTRYALRNVFRWALEAQETREYIRMVEIYGTSCVRLMRSLKMEKDDGSRLHMYVEKMVHQIIYDFTKKWGFEIKEPTPPLLKR